MFEALSNDAQGQCLHLRHGFITIAAIAEHAGEGGNLGNPSTVLFAFELDREGHGRTLPQTVVVTRSARR